MKFDVFSLLSLAFGIQYLPVDSTGTPVPGSGCRYQPMAISRLLPLGSGCGKACGKIRHQSSASSGSPFRRSPYLTHSFNNLKLDRKNLRMITDNEWHIPAQSLRFTNSGSF
jgi:hypothetical protein